MNKSLKVEKSVKGGEHKTAYLRLFIATILDNLKQLSLTILCNHLSHTIKDYLRIYKTFIPDFLRQLSQTILSEYLRLFMATILDNLKQLSLTILCIYLRLSETILR